MGENIYNIYLIKDLACSTGYSIYTIKYYLKLGLIKEVSRSPETRFRYFDDTTIEHLKKIRALRKKGRSIKEIKNELL
jgi:DNA-binding transcriptional MerR regulator